MKIYESDYLIIQYEKKSDRFVQFWKASPPSFDIFKEELLTYTNYYKEHQPSQALWLQQNFSLPLNREIDEWIEENVNIPCVECGNEKVAFVVGKDVLVHLSVMNSFEETSSVVNPNHFASEQEARQWLDETSPESNHNS
ncbi:MAG: hypothetical protein R3214_12135, partial [Christiangramia sp.]|nr:hypothetical protein [Christiangramia sp.]